MASTITTPLAPTVTPPFLRLAPELRNRIYKYAFTDVKQTGLVPHALTQTNSQIRKECRAMYCASIECIEIALRTSDQYKRTMKWLAEEDWSMFPVLPDISIFSYNEEFDRDITISCRRETIVPADELRRQLAKTQDQYVSDQERLRMATEDADTTCLGFDPEKFSLGGRTPGTFTRAVRRNDSWNIRRMEYRTENIPLFVKFRGLAREKQGSEWNQHDLKEVVGWFFIPIQYRNRRLEPKSAYSCVDALRRRR